MEKKEAIAPEFPDKLDINIVQQPTGDESATRVSRRRALLAGLAAAPAVLSLMNRSAWGAAENTQVSCTLVASYVNAGHQWSSPSPSNGNGTLTVGQGDLSRCGFNGK